MGIGIMLRGGGSGYAHQNYLSSLEPEIQWSSGLARVSSRGLEVETWIWELSPWKRWCNAQMVWLHVCKAHEHIEHNMWALTLSRQEAQGSRKTDQVRKEGVKKMGGHMAPWKPNSRSLWDQDDGEPRTLKESRRQGLKCPWSWPSGGCWKFWLEVSGLLEKGCQCQCVQ